MNYRFFARLRRILPANGLLTDPADCWIYGYDNSQLHALPQAVALPVTIAQVQECVRLCHDFWIPVVARGRGTNTVGGTVPTQGGLVLSLERMRQILSFEPENRLIAVEPGLTNQEVQDAAAAKGLFWAPDPTSAAFCTIGGNLACNAAGPRAVKYGATRDNTLGLSAVTGNGDLIHCGFATTKNAVGYDLTRLLIGSEGTLAIIVVALLKLTPLPEARRVIQAIYTDITATAAAVIRIMNNPVTPCALEMIDGRAIEMIRSYSKAALPKNAGGMLMIEIDGVRTGIDESTTRLVEAARGIGLVELRAATTPEESAALWATRKALSPALRTVAPKKINEDVVVPIARLGDLITGLVDLGGRHNLTIVNFGHAGNGNIHVNLLIDPEDPVQIAKADGCLKEIFDLVLRFGGTLSGEHGIGIQKRAFIPNAMDPLTLKVMQNIKTALDPRNILNPAKIF